MRIVKDRNVSDIRHRPWTERLFSWPWRPWVRTQYSPTAYVATFGGEQVCFVSYKTFASLSYEDIERIASQVKPD